MSGLLWSTDRPEFVERVAALAGGTTYREPVAGRGTKADQLPDPHAIAAALAYARNDPDDIGPDIAYCWVLQSDAYRDKVSRHLLATLRSFGSLRTSEAAAAIGVAWEAMVHNRTSKAARPEGVDQRSWDALLLLVIGTLYNSAWNALSAAERAYHQKGAA